MTSSDKNQALDPLPKIVKIHGSFQPNKADNEEVMLLMNLWMEVNEHVHRVEDRKLAREERECGP